jgi:hypothetical protein
MADEQGEAKMDLPKRFARRGIVIYFQIAAAVVSILLGLAQITKESQPIVQKIQENREQVALQKQQEQAQKRADEIAQMQISWQYRGNDGTWRYYSDSNGRFWARVNIQGIYEYCENPQYMLASNPRSYK